MSRFSGPPSGRLLERSSSAGWPLPLRGSVSSVSSGRAGIGVSAALLLALAVGLAWADEDDDEFTCAELLRGVTRSPISDPSTGGYDTVGAILGILKDQCPAEFGTAKDRLRDAGYYREPPWFLSSSAGEASAAIRSATG